MPILNIDRGDHLTLQIPGTDLTFDITVIGPGEGQEWTGTVMGDLSPQVEAVGLKHGMLVAFVEKDIYRPT